MMLKYAYVLFMATPPPWLGRSYNLTKGGENTSMVEGDLGKEMRMLPLQEGPRSWASNWGNCSSLCLPAPPPSN